MKQLIRFSVNLFLVLLLAMGTQAVADENKIGADLRDYIDRSSREQTAQPDLIVKGDGSIAVLVILDSGTYTDPASYFQRSRTSQRAEFQAHIQQAQDEVLRSMPQAMHQRVTYRFQAQHAISANLTPSQIREMAKLKSVVRIEPQPRAEIMSDESHPLTNTDAVHAAGYTGDGITMAIIDDGIESNHPAFGGHSGFPTAKIVGGYDFADNDSDPRNDCSGQSHGTAVTGVAAGNGGGITGTAPDADVVFLKIQSSSICGQPSLDGDIVGAIDWVVANQATYDISMISMSLGGGAFSSSCDSSSIAYRNAVNAANSAGIIVLAASGNDGLCNQISRPACFSNVISVGATYDAGLGETGFCVSQNSCATTEPNAACPSGYRACFENAQTDGVTCYSNSASFLDILAPSNCAQTAATGGGTENCFGGTSSATPFAAGVTAALLEAAGGSLSLDNDEMRTLLASNGVNVTDPKNSRTTPRVDAQASLDAIDGGGGPGPGPGELENDVPVSGLSGSQGSEAFWTFEVPSGAVDLDISISGGSGDADLYVQYGSPPTTGSYDCRPWLGGNNESCTEASPTAGTWHVMIRGYSSYSGVTLVASYSEPGGGGAPCTGCDEYTGTLSGSNDSDIQPNGNYYYSAAGTHEGWLSGPASADFDLRLFRWNGSGWSEADSSLSGDSEEYIDYSGSAGYYYWRIESYSGSGNYTFWLDRP